jgi:hypothetical protein
MKYLKSFFYLFFFFTLWVLIVWITNVYQASFVERNTFFSSTFNWWSQNNLNEHYFLGIINDDYIPKNQVYTSYTIQALFANYTLLSTLNILTGRTFEVTQNFLVYILNFLFLVTLYFTRKNQIDLILKSKNLLHFIWFFLIVGILVTNPLPWISFLKYSTENFYFIISLVFCYLTVFARSFNLQKKDFLFLITGLIISSFFIVFIIPWILLYIYTEHHIKLRKKMWVNLSIVSIYGTLSYLTPFILQRIKGFENVSSSYLFRSGLDGSSSYLKSSLSPIFQAASEQHFENIFLLIISLSLTIYILKINWKSVLDRLILSFIPALLVFSVIPQHSTIHMYMFEFLVIIPLVFNLIFYLLSIDLNKLSPKKYVILTISFIFLIMGQLLEVSKSFINW